MTTTMHNTQSHHGLERGDEIILVHPDYRWWRRLLYFLFCNGTPTITHIEVIESVDSETGLQISTG